MDRAVAFFAGEVSVEGAYVWRYSADLRLREGEGRAEATQGWVQPPGTPSVGGAYLRAWQRTGSKRCLEAARQAAHVLARTQLLSGGWDYRIETDPKRRGEWAYRVDVDSEGERFNTTTLDDNTSQAALSFLMEMDRELDFKDEAIHAAAMYGLDALLAAQYPNGAWPQRFSAPPDAERFPVKRASYPETWSRTWEKRDYRGDYTFNDNTIADTIRVMLAAAEIYGDDRYLQSAKRAGDFILLAQMPDPQPAWAQQYDAEMHPVWARKFEPPAISGSESQGILLVLIDLYRGTKDRKYLEPIPRALAYLRTCIMPDGRLARFYELETNKPLFFTREYELTYKRDSVPDHYSFSTLPRLDTIESRYHGARDGIPKLESPTWVERSPRRIADVQRVLDGMDDRGAWVRAGKLRTVEGVDQIIDSGDFVQNLDTLSRHLEVHAPKR